MKGCPAVWRYFVTFAAAHSSSFPHFCLGISRCWPFCWGRDVRLDSWGHWARIGPWDVYLLSLVRCCSNGISVGTSSITLWTCFLANHGVGVIKNVFLGICGVRKSMKGSMSATYPCSAPDCYVYVLDRQCQSNLLPSYFWLLSWCRLSVQQSTTRIRPQSVFPGFLWQCVL